MTQEQYDEIEEQVKKPKGKKLRGCISWLLYIVIVVCVVYGIVNYVGQRTMVSGDSMLNTLHDGDNLIVDKISYRFRDPERFEIVVFPYHFEENAFYIKRIIGLPGETVQIIEGYVYINGEKLDEHYGFEIIDEDRYGIAEMPVELGEDEYFVLGDNRNNSSDSRNVNIGAIHKDEFIGRAWVRIWPLEDIGVLEH